MKIILSVIALFAGHSVLAQKPRYVPFQYQGEVGIMDINRNIFVGPGTFSDYHVVGDFKAYILRDQLITNSDFFFNAVSGQGEDNIDGRMDRACGSGTKVTLIGISANHDF